MTEQPGSGCQTMTLADLTNRSWHPAPRALASFLSPSLEVPEAATASYLSLACELSVFAIPGLAN